MAPRWIEKGAGKARRQAAAKAEHDALVARHASERVERAAFRAEQEEVVRRRPAKPKRLTIANAPPIRPDYTDADLARVLASASDQPTHLPYPEVMALRERGFTVAIWGDDPRYPVPIYKGDVLTAEGEAWRSEQG